MEQEHEQLKQNYLDQGYVLIQHLFDPAEIDTLWKQAKQIYKTQMRRLGILNGEEEEKEEDTELFEQKMKQLFETHYHIFLNCGKQCQHLILLWKYSLDERILNYIRALGIQEPIVSTRPVLFSNGKQISQSEIHHTVPPHQDWSSMQGSINSMVCWLPLMDMTQEMGPIALIPQSHHLGLLPQTKMNHFGLVDMSALTHEKDSLVDPFISFDVKQGDALFFSSLLVHKSGTNSTNHIRWSVHFRYNDLQDPTFIDRGYPHAYIYKPVEEIICPEFNTQEAAVHYFCC